MQPRPPPPLSTAESADMGVGTMIVFIAMVLVAGVAAGVLISVANDLQQQAEATARQTIKEVATGITVVSVWGDRGSGMNSTVTYLALKIELQPGSPAVAINDLIIQITDLQTQAQLSFQADATNMTQWDSHNETKSTNLKNGASATKYTAEELRDPHDTFYTNGTDLDNPDLIIEPGVLLRVFINATAAGIDLSPDDHVELALLGSHGPMTIEKLHLPDHFVDRLLDLA